MWECKHCSIKFDFNKTSEKANHSRWCAYKETKQKDQIKVCTVCGQQFFGTKRKTCSTKCAHFISDDRKQALSQQRKKYLSENPDKHPWKTDKKKVSVPCENVKKYLRENKIDFVEEFTPLSYLRGENPGIHAGDETSLTRNTSCEILSICSRKPSE